MSYGVERAPQDIEAPPFCQILALPGNRRCRRGAHDLRKPTCVGKRCVRSGPTGFGLSHTANPNASSMGRGPRVGRNSKKSPLDLAPFTEWRESVLSGPRSNRFSPLDVGSAGLRNRAATFRCFSCRGLPGVAAHTSQHRIAPGDAYQLMAQPPEHPHPRRPRNIAEIAARIRRTIRVPSGTLFLNGTVGAAKTTTAEAIGDLCVAWSYRFLKRSPDGQSKAPRCLTGWARQRTVARGAVVPG